NPKLIDQSRRNRIARGSGTQPQDVNQLIKQYDTMAPIMQAMAGKGPGDRMRAIQQLQKSLMADPTGGGIKTKKGTGKRLTPKERAKLKKQRDKDLRRRRRGED
ncbi:MAG: signal recognition particle protein, partial [Planctomycetales bacterium]|nr:signal recognition particle protein [Planctomycetales bacterium]